ncbi:hypothetical protein [Spirochaeta isovalerica]|uniref:Uncharacterized protein n=1 Tax=Spirochaeta isovalerica TaxID=150 RepID=A0A841R6Y6_9SPIO|nr:hypothetical protein [Spirochaeta isovalerica]MBB6478967.1 hypothetical protein [Spirochaeta isovalerica]
MSHIKFSIFRKIAENYTIPEGSGILQEFLNALSDGTDVSDPFFSKALSRIRKEIGRELPSADDSHDPWEIYWDFFFPEAGLLKRNSDEIIREIRSNRIISISKLNSTPITDIPLEMTFTSNILLTVPDRNIPLENLDLPESVINAIPDIMKEKQLYWFDHPVQMGEVPEKNEIIYGLKGLSEALAFEKKRGTSRHDAKLDVLLSVSVTHKGLQEIAAPYISYELEKAGGFPDLNIYIFTEKDTKEILATYSRNSESISEFFGVDGKYGRHYNFLKSVNVLWKLAVNPSVKGTFKIDLDQVFPQEKLVKYTGKSAFEHFMTPLWGAEGSDAEGKSVSLSMIAGALVNEGDIAASLFTPDVSMPDRTAPASDLVFFKHLTMALSTRAEMMTRYGEKSGIDGKKQAISRIHVTGGTNGILVDALMKYRPFTPAFIGRAEDQAYLLSVLNSETSPLLRYVHEDGLIMRHDKHAFAGQSIEAAKDGTYIADILRLIYFSYYAQALPGGIDRTKKSTYPFTGSYISHYPVTLSYMRLIFKILEHLELGEKDRAENILELGKIRLGELLDKLDLENFPAGEFFREREQWNNFYDEIDKLFHEQKSKTPVSDRMVLLKERLKECKVN